MAKKIVNIKARYYQLRCLRDGELTNDIYDLRTWMNKIADKAYEERTKDVDGVLGRLEDQVRVAEDYYAFNFMRMEGVSTTYKAKKTEAAEHIDIKVEEDEYIAKNTVALYDANNGILMIQSNRGSYTESSIQSYINSFYEEKECVLLPVIEGIDFLDERNEYMKIDVRLANLRQFVPTRGSSFEKFIDSCNQMEGLTSHLEIGLGYNRQESLNAEEIRLMIADLNNNRGCVTSAKIRLSDDQKSGLFDLFDNIGHDVVKCQVNSNGEVPFEYLARRMYDIYVTGHANTRILNAILVE